MRKNFLFASVGVGLGILFLGYQLFSALYGLGRATIPAGWVIYQHPRVGLSFYLPSGVNLHVTDVSEADFDRLHTLYFAYFVHRPDGQSEDISFFLLRNPNHLALADFVVAQSGGLFTQLDTTLPPKDLLRNVVTFKVSGLTAMRLARSESTVALTGLGKYITFVEASGDWVVAVTLGSGSRNPADMDWEPTSTGQQVYEKIISTIAFQEENK